MIEIELKKHRYSIDMRVISQDKYLAGSDEIFNNGDMRLKSHVRPQLTKNTVYTGN